MRIQKTRLGLLTLAFFSMLVATPGTYAQELVIEPGDPIIVGVMTRYAAPNPASASPACSA